MGILMKNGQKLSVTDSLCPPKITKPVYNPLSSQTKLLTFKT